MLHFQKNKFQKIVKKFLQLFCFIGTSAIKLLNASMSFQNHLSFPLDFVMSFRAFVAREASQSSVSWKAVQDSSSEDEDSLWIIYLCYSASNAHSALECWLVVMRAIGRTRIIRHWLEQRSVKLWNCLLKTPTAVLPEWVISFLLRRKPNHSISELWLMSELMFHTSLAVLNETRVQRLTKAGWIMAAVCRDHTWTRATLLFGWLKALKVSHHYFWALVSQNRRNNPRRRPKRAPHKFRESIF